MNNTPVGKNKKEEPVRCGCGGEAVIYVTHWWGKCYVCECEECGTESRPCDTEAEAIEAWNRAMGERTAKVDAGHKSVITGKLMDGHCMQCGRYVMDEDDYCPGCGARLEWE